MSNISVLLVDDHNIVRQGLRALLIAEGDMTIVAEAQTGREAVHAAAYLLKQTAVADLVKAIREVKMGNAYFSPAIAKRLREQTCRSSVNGASMPTNEPDLTPREAEVLQLIAEGFANKQIAAELGLSVKTVEKHRQQLMHKLNINDIAGLVRHAADKGIIELAAAGVPSVL